MKKALVLMTLLATAGMADPVNTAVSTSMTLDTQTQGAGALVNEAEVDARGLTIDFSRVELRVLNTKKRLATLILVR